MRSLGPEVLGQEALGQVVTGAEFLGHGVLGLKVLGQENGNHSSYTRPVIIAPSTRGRKLSQCAPLSI